MSTSNMPHIPGAAVMTDTLDFVKNLWGSMSVPGLTAPTLSVDELDKKINDLKAVEAWLNLNMSMLRGSIQALEVQRGTIATLKSVGASMAAAVNQGSDHKSLFESVPYASAFFHHAAPNPAQAATRATPPAPPPPAASAAPEAAKPEQAQPDAFSNAANAAAAQLANPTVWWNLLQDQFKQAVSTAMTPDAVSGAAARATEAVGKFATAGVAKPAGSAAHAGTAAKPAAAKTAVKKDPAKRAAPKPSKD
ncbi:PhaM family polyhydroxyalkanoate granule multifunctional regulatory protein [Rugamonas sp.]|uniref:PhaM family polyhydroxyalkanoate granule multifunctional regulatory protein n=1 Tax=Rugamonas sp. TaxID=1926287 RepID=UPI0025D9F72D|nr:PhaM family polyhydroxyalkanoate granule multifunctional regulatory protein [Rugamonas sp.]